MLEVVERFSQLHFSQLMELYVEGNRENGRQLYPQLPENEQILRVEASFYEYLTKNFFKTPKAVCVMWTVDGRYVSALRLEPYQDGFLVEALETRPDQRKRGYATALMRGVQEHWSQPLYSHVSKRNKASLELHKKCGFQTIMDHAVYIDGSVACNACTLCAPARKVCRQAEKTIDKKSPRGYNI